MLRAREGYAIVEFASKAFLWAHVHQTFRRKQALVQQIMKLRASLEKDLETEDHSEVTKLSYSSAEKTYVKSKQKHLSKLKALMKHKQKQPELHPEGHDRWLINLTERIFTPNQQEVLRMGLNFAPIPPPPKNTIASVKEVVRQFPKDDAHNLQGRVCGILWSAGSPKTT